jgi:hypothetical protein
VIPYDLHTAERRERSALADYREFIAGESDPEIAAALASLAMAQAALTNLIRQRVNAARDARTNRS